MTKLAESYFRIDIGLSVGDRANLGLYLEKVAREHALSIYDQDLEVRAFIEEGSTRAWVVLAGSLYAAIAGYGSFRTGLDYLNKDARHFSENVRSELTTIGVQEDQFLVAQKRLGVPGQVLRTIKRAERLETKRNSLPRSEYDRELASISRSVIRISDEIDSEDDYQVIIPELSSTLRERLPDRLPDLSNKEYAVRPRELPLPKPRLKVLPAPIEDEPELEDEYEFLLGGQTPRLRKKQEN